MTDPAVGAAGVYVHVPFCVKKCYYCDFNSYALDRAAVVQYLDALRREGALHAADLAERPPARPFDTLFIGGGTPTCLSGKDLSALVADLFSRFPFAPGAEVTCEANPGSSNEEKYAALAGAGINRLSIGVQALDDALLARLGRVHTAAEALQSVGAARRAGFANVNVDLMFALPGQSVRTWQETVRRVVDLGPEHLSCYSLIIEDGTPFGDLYARGRLTLPPEDDDLRMYEWAIDYLTGAGYRHYEISNFARPGFESRHNTIYWRIEPYLALGPGAHGYWRDVRYNNVRLPQEYAARLAAGQSPVAEAHAVGRDETMDDVMIFGLRLLAGVDAARFRRRFGRSLEETYPEQLARLEADGLIDVEPDGVRLTRRGLLFGNRVAAEFLRASHPEAPVPAALTNEEHR